MIAKVYFIKAGLKDGVRKLSKKAVKLFKAGNFSECFEKNDFTAVKVHIGESTNTTYIKAPCFKGLIDQLQKLKTKPFLTDTSTLYTGRRYNAVDHCLHAAEHGFDIKGLGIPFIPPDGLLGTSETTVRIDAALNKTVSIAYDIERCQSILTLSHFTGHDAAGIGATLKNIGMGCASRKGKMRQHASIKPKITIRCTKCGECIKYCLVNAISMRKKIAYINPKKCVGCAECVAVCRFKAVTYDWEAENKMLQKNIAEHALGALKSKKNKAVFFNFIISISEDCDCFKRPNMKKISPDIGIAASTDPVAVDKASINLVEERAGKDIQQLLKRKKLSPFYQIHHAEKIGLGTTKYRLIEVNL
ncbi:MAG: DUF362 domain-containing protein [Planctomycetota bacterium]|jgi:uncharacterized Fe-S center protein